MFHKHCTCPCKHRYICRRTYSAVPSNTFDSGGLMLCTGMALHHYTSLQVRGITNTVYNNITQGGMANWWPVLDCRVWLCKVV